MDGPRRRGYGARGGYSVRTRRLRGGPEGRDGVNRDVHTMKIEIEHEGSCLGATGGTGRLIVRDALAKGHSVRCPSSLEGPRPGSVDYPRSAAPTGSTDPLQKKAPPLR